MTTSPFFGLPLIDGQQASPEVTHNEALLLVQALLSGAIDQVNAPPVADEGDVYVIGAAPSGAFLGSANAIAIYFGGEWRIVPGFTTLGAPIAMGADHAGMRIWRRDLNCSTVWTGSAWISEGGAMEESTVAGVGPATGPKRWKFITDEAGGAVPAFNDGAAWRRATDRAVIS